MLQKREDGSKYVWGGWGGVQCMRKAENKAISRRKPSTTKESKRTWACVAATVKSGERLYNLSLGAFKRPQRQTLAT